MTMTDQANPNPTTPEAASCDAPASEVSATAAEGGPAELEALRQRAAELNDQLLRALADADNTRRRAEEEMAKVRKFAVEAFAESLLPVVDSLEAGLNVQEATIEQLREGMQATLRQLLSALQRHKVTPIAPAAGDRFDPHQHQAISMVPAEQPANTVVATLQKGYLIHERVLRPALVTVAVPASEPTS